MPERHRRTLGTGARPVERSGVTLLPGHGATVRVPTMADFEVVAVMTDATPGTAIEERP